MSKGTSARTGSSCHAHPAGSALLRKRRASCARAYVPRAPFAQRGARGQREGGNRTFSRPTDTYDVFAACSSTLLYTRRRHRTRLGETSLSSCIPVVLKIMMLCDSTLGLHAHRHIDTTQCTHTQNVVTGRISLPLVNSSRAMVLL